MSSVLLLLFLSSCKNQYWGNYVERNSKQNLKLLKKYSDYYTHQENSPAMTEINPERAEEIKEFFADK